MKNKFTFNSVQSHALYENGSGREQIMEVRIKNGRGHKKVTIKNNTGRILASKNIPLNDDEIQRIMNKEFVPGLFRPCLDHCNSARLTRRLSKTRRRMNAY